MKVLYLTNKPLYPSYDGGSVAMTNFLKCLHYQNVEVKHILIATSKHPFELKNYPKDVAEKIQPESVFLNTNTNLWSVCVNFFKIGSFNINRFRSADMEKLISTTLKQQQFDAVILESLYVTPYTEIIRANFSGGIFLRTHNIEYKIWNDLAFNAGNPIKKSYFKKLARDLERYERQAVRDVDGIMAISNKDIEAIEAMEKSAAAIVIPVAIEAPDKQPLSFKNNNFFHIGAMNWQPNIEAVNRLISLFPLIKAELPEAELHIAGSASKRVDMNTNAEGIHFDGFVKDLNDYCRDKGILVTPLISGSGIRIKILEMMALGIPVITTEIGAQGIEYKESDCLVIAETDMETVASCVELATSEAKRREIGINAVNYIQKNHNIETISKHIVEFIQKK